MGLQSCVLSLRIYVVCEVIAKVLSLIVIGCVFDRHWLLGYALHFINLTCRDIQEELGSQIVPNNHVKEDFLS